MNTPAILVGFVVSTLLAFLFHLIIGGGAGRLLLYLILSWCGFLLGHFVGVELDLNFFNLGMVHLGTAVIGSILSLVIGHWLSLVDREKPEHPATK